MMKREQFILSENWQSWMVLAFIATRKSKRYWFVLQNGWVLETICSSYLYSPSFLSLSVSFFLCVVFFLNFICSVVIQFRLFQCSSEMELKSIRFSFFFFAISHLFFVCTLSFVNYRETRLPLYLRRKCGFMYMRCMLQLQKTNIKLTIFIVNMPKRKAIFRFWYRLDIASCLMSIHSCLTSRKIFFVWFLNEWEEKTENRFRFVTLSSKEIVFTKLFP